MKRLDVLFNVIFLTILALTFLGCEISIEYCKNLVVTNGLLKSGITFYTLRSVEVMAAVFFITEVLELYTGIPLRKQLRKSFRNYFQTRKLKQGKRGIIKKSV